VCSIYTTKCHTIKAYKTKWNTLLYTTQIRLFNKWVLVVILVVVAVVASTVQKRWIPCGTLLVANLQYLLIHRKHTVSQICWPHWGSWYQRVMKSAANIIHKTVYYNKCRIMLPSLSVFESFHKILNQFQHSVSADIKTDWPFQILYFYFLCNWTKFKTLQNYALECLCFSRDLK
jgi:hypothetical protein